MRKTFTMTNAQFDKLLAAMQPVPAMWIGGPPRSVQQNANDAWAALGREMGFDGTTVRPGSHELEFSAEEVAETPRHSRAVFGQWVPEADDLAELEYQSWLETLGAYGVKGT